MCNECGFKHEKDGVKDMVEKGKKIELGSWNAVTHRVEYTDKKKGSR